MNTKLLPIILIVAGFSSCSTAYKAGQTPDDVYYSPVRPQAEYVKTENNEDKNVYNSPTNEDISIRINIHNRRWRNYNDYDYNYPYNNQYPPLYVNPKGGTTTPVLPAQPRKFNLGAYKKPADNTTTTTTGIKDLKVGNQVPPPANNTAPVRTFKPGTGVGNFIRQLFSGSGQSSTNNADNTSPTRTFGGTNNNNTNNNSSNNSNNSGTNSGSRSGSSSSSSSAPVRTFEKKN